MKAKSESPSTPMSMFGGVIRLLRKYTPCEKHMTSYNSLCEPEMDDLRFGYSVEVKTMGFSKVCNGLKEVPRFRGVRG